MWLAIAFGRLTITIVYILARFVWDVLGDSFKWTEKHRGWVTSLATVVIAVLTCEYATYSKLQWQTLENTLNYQIEHTRARLAVSKLTITDFPDRPYATFCIENDGHAMADRISGLPMRPFGAGGGQQPFGPSPDQVPRINPSRYGRTMGEGAKDCSYHIPVNQLPGEKPTFSEIARGAPKTGFWFEVIASYRDAASKRFYPAEAADCVYWEGYFKQFFPCIVPSPNQTTR